MRPIVGNARRRRSGRTPSGTVSAPDGPSRPTGGGTQPGPKPTLRTRTAAARWPRPTTRPRSASRTTSPDEFFYESADAASLVSAGGEKVLASFALEGAFANGPVRSGDQIVFSRIRYRINAGLKGDTDYRITHPPYGTDTVHADPGATGS